MVQGTLRDLKYKFSDMEGYALFFEICFNAQTRVCTGDIFTYVEIRIMA